MVTFKQTVLDGGYTSVNREWFVNISGQQLGPYTWGELRQKANTGEITWADQVWNQSLSGWIRADQVAGLFPSEAPPPPPAVSYQAPVQPPPVYPGAQPQKKGKGCLVTVVVILLLLAGGAAAVVYFLFLRDGDSGKLSFKEINIAGCWYGEAEEEGEEGYFQFMDDGTVNLAMTHEGYWTTGRYRLVEDSGQTYLEMYNTDLQDWVRTARVGIEGNHKLNLTDVWAGMTIPLKRISERQFQKVIDQLEYYSD